jgi:hypothetical protein
MQEDIKIIGSLRLRPRRSTAELIDKHPRTLVRWELDGKGPPITRIGRDVYYEESALEKWIRSQTEVTA